MEEIAEAIEIISSGVVKGNVDEYLPTMLQKSLASLRVDMQTMQQCGSLPQRYGQAIGQPSLGQAIVQNDKGSHNQIDGESKQRG